MPITQDRFLSVIDGAARILDTQRNIITLTKDNADIITKANSVVEHTQDEYARSTIQELLGIVYTISEMINNDHQTHMDLVITVSTERNYFRRVKRSNEKAAYYQRQKRNLARDGHGYVYEQMPMPQTVSQNPTPIAECPTVDNDPEFKKIQADLREVWHQTKSAAGTNVPERSEERHPQAVAVPQELTVTPKEHKDGTIRYLPSDDELNAPPISDGKIF